MKLLWNVIYLFMLLGRAITQDTNVTESINWRIIHFVYSKPITSIVFVDWIQKVLLCETLLDKNYNISVIFQNHLYQNQCIKNVYDKMPWEEANTFCMETFQV